MKSRSKVRAISGSSCSMRPWKPSVFAFFMMSSSPAWKASIVGTGELAVGLTAAGGLAVSAVARGTRPKPGARPRARPRATTRQRTVGPGRVNADVDDGRRAVILFLYRVPGASIGPFGRSSEPREPRFVSRGPFRARSRPSSASGPVRGGRGPAKRVAGAPGCRPMPPIAAPALRLRAPAPRSAPPAGMIRPARLQAGPTRAGRREPRRRED